MLVLTDLSIIGKFRFPQNVDFVHLPGILYKSGKEFRAKNLNIASANALKLRRKIVQSTAKTFKPHFTLVEADLNKLSVAEMYKNLRYMKEALPETKIIWGLPDIIGNPNEIKKIWTRFKISIAFEKVVDEIWVYGHKDIFDFVAEYHMPEAMANKLVETGYLKSPMLSSSKVSREVSRKNIRKPLVLVNGGSGLDSFHLIDNYVRYLEKAGDAIPFYSMIITGPMMPTREKQVLMKRIERLPNVSIRRFCKQALEYTKFAELIISTGGYNILCEIMTYRKKAIVMPVGGAFEEHFYRAAHFAKHQLIQLLLPKDLCPEKIGELVGAAFSDRTALSLNKKNTAVPMNGLEVIVERIYDLAGIDPAPLQRAAL